MSKQSLSDLPVIVVGAGIVGIAVALSLRLRGVEVLLVDRGGPGEGCSSGNAGMVQTGSSLPIAAPGLLGKLPRMLLDPQGPLALRWRHFPALLPWGLRLLANASQASSNRNERALAGMLRGASAAWADLSSGCAAGTFFRARGELYVVRSAASFAGYAPTIEALRRNGVACEILDAAGVRRYEPQLAPAYAHGLYLPESAYVVDPLALSRCLFEHFLAQGGRFEQADVVRITRKDEGIAVALADHRVLSGARVVVAAGARSAELARSAGLKLPIEPLRGYHVMLPQLDTPLAGPVIEGEISFAVTPMLGGNRVAGTIEFAGANAQPDWRRADMLVPMARRMIPALAGSPTARWFGDRPGTPDSLPVLGPVRNDDRVWYACGHGTLGLTLAAQTGRLIALAMSGETASLAAIRLFSPDRFIASSSRERRRVSA